MSTPFNISQPLPELPEWCSQVKQNTRHFSWTESQQRLFRVQLLMKANLPVKGIKERGDNADHILTAYDILHTRKGTNP